MNRIERDVYVLEERLKFPIHYVQGTDNIPLKFFFRDYKIPSGTEARVYVQKPSTMAIYAAAQVSTAENSVTVKMDKQMVAEAGLAKLQLELRQGETTLYTFVYELIVQKSLVAIDSTSGSSFLDEYIDQINELVTIALNKAETEAANALTQATYAKNQGDYAKIQGDHAKTQGDYAKIKADSLQVQFDELETILAQTVDGSLLVEIRNLLDDMYRTCTDADIDNIIAGTYTDEDDEGSIFDPASNEDIDNIIAGSYIDTPEIESGDESDIDAIINSLFN